MNKPADNPKHEGCDVKAVVNDQGGDCDVRLEPTIQDVIEGLEDSEHDMTGEEWAAFLRSIAPAAYADPPPPKGFVVAEPGTEAKIAAMSERQARGEHLYAAGDLSIDHNQRAARETHRCRNGRDEHGELHALQWERDREEVAEEVRKQMEGGQAA